MFDYIEINYRNGAYSLSPVIPKKKAGAEESHIPAVSSLQLRSSYLNRESQQPNETAAGIIDRRMISLTNFKRDREKLSHSWSKPLHQSRDSSKATGNVSVEQIVDIEEEGLEETEVVEQSKGKLKIEDEIESPSKLSEDSPILIKDDKIFKKEVRNNLDQLVSFRRYHEVKPISKPTERSRSERVSDLRHNNFNRETSNNQDSYSRFQEYSAMERSKRGSIHKFEINEDSEISLHESPLKESIGSNRKSSSEIKLTELGSLNSSGKHQKSSFSKLDRDIQYAATRMSEKPSPLLIDLRGTRKMGPYERRIDLGRSNASKFSVNLQNRIKYDNILQRPTDTVMKKFINLNQNKPSSNFGVSNASRMFSNHSDTLRQQLYSSNGIRHVGNGERKRQIGITSGLLLSTKADELLGRRPGFIGSSRWANKLR